MYLYRLSISLYSCQNKCVSVIKTEFITLLLPIYNDACKKYRSGGSMATLVKFHASRNYEKIYIGTGFILKSTNLLNYTTNM